MDELPERTHSPLKKASESKNIKEQKIQFVVGMIQTLVRDAFTEAMQPRVTSLSSAGMSLKQELLLSLSFKDDDVSLNIKTQEIDLKYIVCNV